MSNNATVDSNATANQSDADRRNEAISNTAEGLQTMVTGAMEVFGALYDLLELSTKATNIALAPETEPAPEPAPAPKEESMPAPTPAPKEEPKPAPTPAPKPTPKPANTVTITPDDITKAAVALVRKNRENSKKIQALLQTYGADQLSALGSSKYEAFMNDLEALGS